MIKRRSQSFFGLHFDFHASPERSGASPIGGTLREEDIREICRLLHLDFLQIDCKGHPGWASYPTACGNAMPAFAGDPLAMWRRVTQEEGVALYLHYSGVIDERYCAGHPDECAVAADGSRSSKATRTAGRYVDELLIPQFMELAGKYGADGVWVDGDCWGSEVDFHPDTVAAFEAETGISLNGRLPAAPEDAHYEDYREFCRELFRRYVRHYVDAVHAKYPGVQIASNWAYSDHMPEAVSAQVDFISGDLNPWDSFNSARYAARAIAQQNHVWDLMCWNFRTAPAGRSGHTVKHPLQIMQEAAAIISQGGGFQNYITQYPDGAPRMEQIRRMKPVEAFVRAREPFCFRGQAVHQVALLLSTYDRHRESASLFSRNGCEKIMGMTSLLCDAGHATEIVSEHTLTGRAASYPVIVVPELFSGLAPETVEELLDYARGGGSLVLAGRTTCALFAAAGAPLALGESRESASFTLDGEAFGIAFDASALSVQEGETLARMSADARSASEALAVVCPFGRGQIAAVGMDLGSAYQAGAQYLHRALINALLSRLYAPIVAVESAEGLIEVSLLRKDGRTLIQLVNGNGNHRSASVASEDFIPACRRVALALRLAQRPKALILQPEGRSLPFEYCDGRARVIVDEVPLHEIIEIEL
ncbi:MAG: hypothetical protein IJ048_13385 [Clostridia bacterium]|nr:hypothetical protein [Clostridia bacterium]